MQRAVKMNMNSQQPENVTGAESAQTASDKARCASATGSAPVISIFATFPTEPEWERRHERCKTRKEAADYIRDARAKGGFNINVFDPWTKKREAQNVKADR